MAHHICCPKPRQSRDVESPLPPYRAPIALDGVLTMGLLPEDHPHGRRFHLSPVDFGILKSPKIAHKIKLKMSRKSSRTLRKELAQLTSEPYDGDAHAMTSNEVVHATEATLLGGDGARDVEAPASSVVRHDTSRFGTTEDDNSRPIKSRPGISSPSLYSRSQSRVEGELTHGTGSMGGSKIVASQDFLGHYYRNLLSGRPSLSTPHLKSHSRSASRQQENIHERQVSDSHSRHWSGSTESTIKRRLEQSRIDYCVPEPADIWAFDNGHYDMGPVNQPVHAASRIQKSIAEVEHKEEV